MKIVCPKCGAKIDLAEVLQQNAVEKPTASSLGRKPLGIPFVTVCDAIGNYSTVQGAADWLGCSRGYLYKVLKAHGLTMEEVRNS